MVHQTSALDWKRVLNPSSLTAALCQGSPPFLWILGWGGLRWAESLQGGLSSKG